MSRLQEMGTPVFWVEGHPGPLERQAWRIEVRGLCQRPRIFSWEDMTALPKALADARLTSVTRFSVFGCWGGVRVSTILEEVGAASEVTHIRFWSLKGIYDTSIPLEIALREKTLLVWDFDGEPLEEDYGGRIKRIPGGEVLSFLDD